MKNNKGFAPIAIILIIIAVLAVGGIAYYMGKSSSTLPNVVNNPPQENQNNVVTPPVQNTEVNNVVNNTETNCLPTTTPWIKITSPNGGETYTSGQQITVKWTSCNFSPSISAGGLDIKIAISAILSSGENPVWTLPQPSGGLSENDGQELITLPLTLENGTSLPYGKNFKISVSRNDPSAQMPYLGDLSDNLFTINAKSVVSNCLPTTSPWIKVLSPAGGEIYTVGQQVALKWTSCNVQNVWLAFASGGKDFGEITYPNPVPASQGSYQWTASNPGKAFTGLNKNNYQIIAGNNSPFIQPQFPNVTPGIIVRSGTFSVQ